MAARTKNEQLLIDFHNAKRAAHDAQKEADRLKEMVDALPVKTYGKWEKLYGPPRRIVDQSAIRDVFDELGQDVPMKDSSPVLIVRPKT
jgi:hypothetical protein